MENFINKASDLYAHYNLLASTLDVVQVYLASSAPDVDKAIEALTLISERFRTFNDEFDLLLLSTEKVKTEGQG